MPDVLPINLTETGVKATSSSKFPNNADPLTNYKVENIIDGNKNTNLDVDHCNCCAATSGHEQGWMELNLRKQYLLQRIVITGRSDGKVIDKLLLIISSKEHTSVFKT